MSTAETGHEQVMTRNQMPSSLTVAATEIALTQTQRYGGIIVIDFIDMQSAENKQVLYDKMKEG
jgi:ribonuclease G